MHSSILVALASILVLGIAAQWISWLFRLPSILMLLVFGLLAGPGFHYLNPDQLFGQDLLLPIVSMFVAIILFEGALTLNIKELQRSGGVIRSLVTTGVVITWLIAATAAYFILDMSFQLSLLLGAILVVSGPTVIIPLLRDVRPTGQTGTILKWEGIVIDPVGAMLAVLVFEAILVGGLQEASTTALKGLVITLGVGTVMGALGAGILILLLKKYWVPDYLENPVSIMLVVAVFTVSNLLQTESGLFSVTLMGILMANQKSVSIKQILEFKENLRVLFISTLFIMLAARITRENIMQIGWEGGVFLAILVFIARPLGVFASSFNSDLTTKEKIFLSWVAPRGIVAAAISSIFALHLAEHHFPNTELLVTYTFLVITGTVALYGLTASPLARWLGLAQPNPQGMLFVGAHSWARDLANLLQGEGYKVIVSDTNWNKLQKARMDGLNTYGGNILTETALDEIDLGGIGRILALTPNREVNSLACLHFKDIFGRANVFQLPPDGELGEEGINHLQGRFLFDQNATYSFINQRLRENGQFKKTTLTKEFDFLAFQERNPNAIVLMIIGENGAINVVTADIEAAAQPGQTLISIVDVDEEKELQERREKKSDRLDKKERKEEGDSQKEESQEKDEEK